jgi:hypothetical protein
MLVGMVRLLVLQPPMGACTDVAYRTIRSFNPKVDSFEVGPTVGADGFPISFVVLCVTQKNIALEIPFY